MLLLLIAQIILTVSALTSLKQKGGFELAIYARIIWGFGFDPMIIAK